MVIHVFVFSSPLCGWGSLQRDPVSISYSTLLQKLYQIEAGLSGEFLDIHVMHILLFL